MSIQIDRQLLTRWNRDRLLDIVYQHRGPALNLRIAANGVDGLLDVYKRQQKTSHSGSLTRCMMAEEEGFEPSYGEYP